MVIRDWGPCPGAGMGAEAEESHSIKAPFRKLKKLACEFQGHVH